MLRLKLPFCIICNILPLVCFAVTVLGSTEAGPELELDESKNSEYSLLLQRLEAQDGRIKELEKSREELKEQVEALKKQVDELKEEMTEDGGLSLLTPPLRGPPGKDGKQGEKGDKGEDGKPGVQGERGYLDPRTLKSCSDAMEILPSPRSKTQLILPPGNTRSVEVLCDFKTDGGGWTIIQKRSSGPQQEFNRTWTEYANGFGSLDGNFWLGLDNIHALTKKDYYELRIELEDFEGNKRWAKYSSFYIYDASYFYRLYISGFSPDSTAGDSMTPPNQQVDNLNKMSFSTKDNDNDLRDWGNCANYFGGGGWWFNNCAVSGLNGVYFEEGEIVPQGNGLRWDTWKRNNYSLAKTEMKIRKK